MTNFIWFARTSWRYLGCDRGTGRWSARRQYVKGFARSAWRFMAAIRRDRIEARR